MNTFSKRHGYSSFEEVEFTVREDAPISLRNFIIDVAEGDCRLRPSQLRSIICRILKESSDSNNWSEYPNIDNEVRGLIEDCRWYKVYDIIEKLYDSLYDRHDTQRADTFQNEINEFFLEKGVGWKLIEGRIEVRGGKAFEKTIKSAKAQLESNDRHITASKELHEAIIDLSRRPTADTTGAIQHAMASLECVAREITGERTLTLGRIMERNKTIIPSPLNIAIEKSWGYASEHGASPRGS
jgi:AbiJ N-terminal domain 4